MSLLIELGMFVSLCFRDYSFSFSTEKRSFIAA